MSAQRCAEIVIYIISINRTMMCWHAQQTVALKCMFNVQLSME